MPKAAIQAIFASALVLAGCMGAESPTAPEPSAMEPHVHPSAETTGLPGPASPAYSPPAENRTVAVFDLSGCDYAGLFIRVPPEVVRGIVPPEFTLIEDVGGVAISPLGAMRCDAVVQPSSSAAGAFAWFCVNIEPPEDERLKGTGGGQTIHMYAVEWFAEGAALSMLEASNVSVHEAAIAVDLRPAATLATVSGQAVDYTLLDALTPVTGGAGNVVYNWRMINKSTEGYGVVAGHLQPDLQQAGTTAGSLLASAGAASDVFGPTAPGLLSYGPGYRFANATAYHVPLT